MNWNKFKMTKKCKLKQKTNRKGYIEIYLYNKQKMTNEHSKITKNENRIIT